MSTAPLISVVIPTFNREQVLLGTIKALIPLEPLNKEILVVDQTAQHSEQVANELFSLNGSGDIRWIRLWAPSIPVAMNKGAALAQASVILFLDDDIIPEPNLIMEHMKGHEEEKADLIAGRVIQPWDRPEQLSSRFADVKGRAETEFMGGNFSIMSDRLFTTGGFDENFKGAAYRFEKEFADRLLEQGATIWFEPTALIHHLHHNSGGTRSHGDYLHSCNPRHPVGAYYYLLISRRVSHRWEKIAHRLLSSIRTRHHLHKPWYIPVTLCSEFSGLIWAIWLRMNGARLPFIEEQKAR